MIIYGATKSKFFDDILSNDIENIVRDRYTQATGRRVAPHELLSWRHSLQFVHNVLADDGVPRQTGVFIEYHIQPTAKRVDLMLTGIGEREERNVVLVELKQWAEAEVTDMDGIVRTQLGKAVRDTSHPSYQAWSYASLLREFNEALYVGGIRVYPCVYAHNFGQKGVLDHPFYKVHVDRAPLFLKADALRLREFIKQHIRKGDDGQVMFEIEKGKIRPSKMLAESIASMLQGNEEFVMIDDQKLVFEKALSLVKKAEGGRKQVFIVEGGPGTGKSVVAVNLLARMVGERKLAMYVTKNQAPRVIYEQKLAGSLKKSEIGALFKGSASFTKTKPDAFEMLIADEAHRLNVRSQYIAGENQVMELIRGARVTVFLLDEDQRVTLKDIGTREEIEKWAWKLGAEIHRGTLASQFRCNGADGYLPWLDNALQIRETANWFLGPAEFDFRVMDTASALRERICELNKEKNKARMVAGYCWDWVSKKKDRDAMDIRFPECGFAAQWNLEKDGSLWIMAPESVKEVGCIHTCQGLELDHVGVIVGPDLVVRDGKVVTDGRARASTDTSIYGFKGKFAEDPVAAQKLVEPIIKNTYRTLLTRGMKSCSVYFTDGETREHFRSLLKA